MSPVCVDARLSVSVAHGSIKTKGTTTQVGPDRSGNSTWSGPRPTKGTTGLMHIVRPTSDSPPPPPRHLGMSRVDGCPECILNVEMPVSSDALPNGYRNTYVCSDCGFSWVTEWGS